MKSWKGILSTIKSTDFIRISTVKCIYSYHFGASSQSISIYTLFYSHYFVCQSSDMGGTFSLYLFIYFLCHFVYYWSMKNNSHFLHCYIAHQTRIYINIEHFFQDLNPSDDPICNTVQMQLLSGTTRHFHSFLLFFSVCHFLFIAYTIDNKNAFNKIRCLFMISSRCQHTI